MDLVTIIGIILMGVALMIVELIFIPGTTFIGVGGFLCSLYGIYLSFETFGSTVGLITLVSSVAFTLGAVLIAFKYKSWERFSLKGTIDSRFNEQQHKTLNVGDEGLTISSLKPYGKASFKVEQVEVTSEGSFIAEQQKIKIVRIENNRITVAKVN